MRTLKKGSVGDDVKTLQKVLGITVDGCFGSQTEAAVKKWQAAHGLVADGIVGAKTWATMSEQTTDIPDVIYDPLNVHITKAANREIKYIAIHYTAGISSRKGSARSVKSVFTVHKSSADFAVDDAEAVQFNPDLKNYYCWAVGDPKNKYSKGGSLYGVATNRNTVSIEICSNLAKGSSAREANHRGWSFTDAELRNAAKLTKALMKKFNIPIDRVVRHYDVSGKVCPGVVGWNDEIIYTIAGKQTSERSDSTAWEQFKKLIAE